LSLRELWTVRNAMRQRQQDQMNRDIALAWHIKHVSMSVTRSGDMLRLPAMRTFLIGQKSGPTSLRDQQVAAFEAFSQRYKIPIKVKQADGSTART